ncbi:hypothetical protein Tco_0929357 [Tanacetum coccineum]
MKHDEFDESNAYVLERFYTSAGNPVKEILLKLNLPDHRILKDGGEGEFALSTLDVLQRFGFFLQIGFTLILATLDGLDVGLLGDVIGEDDCDDDG